MRLLHTGVCAALIAAGVSHSAVIHADAPDGSVVFLEDADTAAGQWVRANPEGMAVAIRLGPATTVPVDTIEYWLRKDFADHGIVKLRFFYERAGDHEGSSVVFRTRNHAWGPFALAHSREQVSEAAAQHLFELQRGLN